ncbi:4-hydroxy-tetrahydrodipicolinate reductase [Cryobacterium tepidiphilum]|jgi:4-hydroxy-tetrahydrodipicolinate reductase|uniref:4-hydroxy-tetrahydrodipicolinate reductase n=1 Tax=Cryobacterium tepidiphilum TaxID=2486026 RepID=A0A3M8LAY3_9MICO|nr:4-hydroxy-tetrahydrodipicolinate reductase [Cryobacterium tepidiphilum]RNE62485.1 4-hydroxy-tetrahydrodipicolinate reductase [Cryobacterium tepidiphilum]
MTTRVAVIGATGKMGRLVADLVEQSDDFELVARLSSASELSDMLPAEIAVDVTRPGVSQDVVEYAVDHGLRVLVGTSGWSEERIAALSRRVEGHDDTGVVIIPNFSLGSVLATFFATLAAPFFDSIEIIEAHHAGKVDSPSGTAVRTAELVSAARAAQGPVSAPHTDQRARGQEVGGIPVHSLRLAGVQARQDVIFGGGGETLTIRHDTTSPSSYERGILLALAATRDAVGVTVGLDKLIPLTPAAAGQTP